MRARELVDHFGGLTAAAKAMGVKPPSVSEWLDKDEVPLGRQCQAEIITSGKLKADRSQLGPSAAASENAAA